MSKNNNDKDRRHVSYLYDESRNIVAVQLPYAEYLALVKNKKDELLKNDGNASSVGHSIFTAAVNEHREKGKTLAAIARQLGVSQPYLSKLLKKTTNIGTDTLNKYLRLLDSLK